MYNEEKKDADNNLNSIDGENKENKPKTAFDSNMLSKQSFVKLREVTLRP